MCIPILVTTLPEWLSGTEPLPHTPGAVRPSSLCLYCFAFTAINDRHSDTTIFQLRAHWVRISWSTGSENLSDMCPRVESNPRLPACKASTLSTRPGSPHFNGSHVCVCVFIPILVTTFPEWLSGTEPLPHTPGAVRPSSSCM